MSIAENVKLLSLATVAGWQTCLHKIMPSPWDQVHAELPPLQRGFIWKPDQVENLWDSLMRKFPIGSFLISEINDKFDAKGWKLRKSQRFKLACGKSYRNETDGSERNVFKERFHLLDGQQRATAIALAFINPWKCNECELKFNPPAVLWVDLTPPAPESGIAYLFRVCTRSHPWGYKSGRSERLESYDRSDAFSAYVAANSNVLSGRDYTRIPLTHTWPWDATVPLPVALLLESLSTNTGGNHWREVLKDSVGRYLKYQDESQLITKTKRSQSWLEELIKALNGTSLDLSKRLEEIASHLKNTLNGISIPALLIPREQLNGELTVTLSPEYEGDSESGNQTTLPPDPLETIFIRTNAGGTVLSGEELIYSIYKAIWPNSIELVERIGTRFVVPSRLVALSARLVLARIEPKTPPDAINVNRFRRLVHGDTKFRKELEKFLVEDAERIFESARRLMIGDPGKQNSYQIGGFLAADVANRAQDIFFLLLWWIDQMKLGTASVADPSEVRHRSILGAITGLSWFAADQKACLRSLWKYDNKELGALFTWKYMKQALDLKENGNFKMIFLPSPDNLYAVLRNALPSRGHDDKWNKWDWYKDLQNAKPMGCIRWYDQMAGLCWNEEYLEDETKHSKALEAWSTLIDRLGQERRLVLYAQRHWLKRWFPQFDPTSPDQLEDTDRPWDWDHIFPTKYVYNKKGLAQILREWHWTIGNLRAWPMQSNRSDGESLPREKLSEERAQNINAEGITCREDLLEASFITNRESILWKKCAPEIGKGDPLVSLKDASSDCRQNLLTAIICRFVSLYRHWYEELNIEKIFNSP